jgi:2-alkenal reductase
MREVLRRTIFSTLKPPLRGSLIILAIVVLLLSACAVSSPGRAFRSSASLANERSQRDIAKTDTPWIASEASGQEEASLVGLYARSNPSVVNVTVYGSRDGQVGILGQGSGFVYDDLGRIVTNAHVVRNEDLVEVTFYEGTTLPAEILGLDPQSDLAVLEVESVPAGVAALPLGEMSELAVGQTVVAIGNPFGLDGTLTRGIISGLGRTIPSLTSFSIPEAIQTDAAINPGNSGGPLLDLHGHVVGVNAQIETDGFSRTNIGVGFAIPVNIVRRVVPELISEGTFEWAWLGIAGRSLIPTLVEAMDLPGRRGAYVAEVTPGGPADRAGLQGAQDTRLVNGRPIKVGGDVIMAIDGNSVASFEDLLIYIALEADPGQEVSLTVWRDGGEQEIPVRLGKRPERLPLKSAPSDR